MSDEEELLGAKDLAKIFKVSRPTLTKWREQEGLPWRRVGSNTAPYKYLKSEALHWFDQQQKSKGS